MPFGFRIAPDTLPSGIFSATGSRSALAVSGFRLRARLGFSIPVPRSRPARRYPRFRIRRSSSERRGDFNPHDSRAAQRTLRASPPPQRARPVPHGRPVDHPCSRIGASRVACAFLVYMLPPLPRCSGWAYSRLISPIRVSLPRKGHRVGLHIVLFEACSAFTRVAACTLARSPYFVTRYPKASDISSPPCLLRLLPAGAVAG